MSAITRSQKKKILAALDRGVKDLAIAKTLDVPVDAVRNIRRELGLTREQITAKRYEHWKRMLEKGHSAAYIANLYCVETNSVRLMLWKHFRFSLVEAKKKGARARLEMEMEIKIGGRADQYSW